VTSAGGSAVVRLQCSKLGSSGWLAASSSTTSGAAAPSAWRSRVSASSREPVDDRDLARIEELAALGPVREAIAAALRDLPPAQRDAVAVRVVDELPYPEVARRLGVTEGNAHARVSRGLRAVAHSLDESTLVARQEVGDV
jgi:DNA-directed RNA polymerase specialized sigma24 family protein